MAGQRNGGGLRSSPGGGRGGPLPVMRVQNSGMSVMKVLRLAGTGLAVAVSIAFGAFLSRFAMSGASSVVQSVQLESQMSSIEAAARAKYPGLPPVEAMSKYAQEVAPARLAKLEKPSERKQHAAGVFMGFYLVNTEARVDYCAKQGVEISDFTDAFRRTNSKPYGRALTIIEASGISEEEFVSRLRRQFSSLIEKDMYEVALKTGSTVKGACQLMQKRAETFVDYLHFKTLQPEVYAALMAD